MHVTYVARSFLDYRVPVFAALDELTGGRLCVVFSQDYVPKRVSSKVTGVLGTRAIGLSGEWQLGHHDNALYANSTVAFQYQPELLKTIRRCRPDVLIGDGFFKWTLPSTFYKVMHGTPLVICYERTFHTERKAQWYRTASRRLVVRVTDAVCCSGRLCGEYTRSLGFPADRITYGHQVADVKTLLERSGQVAEQQIQERRSDLHLRGIVFLYVGRLIPLKGVMQLLEAWRIFSREAGNARCSLLIVGGGPQEAECRAYCIENDLDNVRMVGPIDYDMLPIYYRSSDVFVMPTLEDNWSLVVPEAMACGLPILCSKYNGCWPELVRPENGWVFDPLDISDTVNILALCLSKRELLQSMGEASRHIVENHTASQAANAIMEACSIAVKRHQ